jgi:hypothetical protein
MALFRRRERIRRVETDRYEVRLPAVERDLLVDLVRQLRDVLLVTTDDPMVRRLFPAAYHDDAERDREYQQLVRDELLGRRLVALELLEQTAAATDVTESDLTGWLTAVNDLRLVLGTRLDVSEDDGWVDEDDPDAPAYAVYGYLGLLLTEIVDALHEGLPPATESEI